jgi:predicted outer membrane repeat protein
MKMKFLLVLALILITAAGADTFYVPADYPTIQTGIDSLEAGDVLLVCPGIYHENIDYLSKNITVASLYYTTQDTSYISQTIIDGSFSGSVVTIDGVEQGTAVLSGFTIQNGYSQLGGGIYCPLSDIELSYLIVQNNNAHGTMEDGFGGGLYLWNSNCSLHHLLIANNSGDKGAGLYSVNSDLETNEIEYQGNSAQYSGGGAHIHGGNVNLCNSRFSGNSAQYGGGLHVFCNNSVLQGVTFTENSAILAGGGIYNRSGMSFSIENRCSIYHNTVESRQGGSDFYSQDQVTVYVDTFTVLYPTSYHAQPRENFTFDIWQGMLQQVNADLYVSPYGDNINPGISPGVPLKTIQYACSIILADSLNCHTIHLAPGIYNPETNNESFPIILPNYVSLQGSGREVTVLDAQSQGGVLKLLENDGVSVSSMTLINGNAPEGAGIYALNSTAELHDLAINHCMADIGGGINLFMGNYILCDLIVSNNTADTGGGIYLSNYENISMDSLIIENNHANIHGGGISAYGPEIYTSNSQIRNNTAQDWGGGIYVSGNTNYFLDNIEITGNQVNDHSGGGIWVDTNSVLNMSDVKIAYNSCPESGGGIYLSDDAELVFDQTIRCNIYLNNAFLRGAGADIYSVLPVEVIVDTFTVMSPTEYHTAPLQNFSFDILNCQQQQTAADLYVSPVGDNSHSGLSEDEPLQTIQYACSIILADSLNPHTINLLPGNYSYSSNWEFFPVSLPDYVSLTGDSQEDVILDAENNSAVVRLYNSLNNTISHLTIRNGNSGAGAGIYCYNSNPSIHDVVLQSNNAQNSYGGAIYVEQNSQVELYDLSVQNNSARDGGGLAICNSSAILQDILFASNVATNYGGGIMGSCAQISLQNVTFQGNYADEFGGGVYCTESNIEAANCLFYDNIALNVGAGICSANFSLLNVYNSTFTCNSAHSSSGIHSFLSSSLYVANCIFWDNSDDVVRFFGSSPNDTFCLVYSNVQGGTENIVHGNVGLIHISEENINQNPLFVSAPNDDFQLMPNSPCIDAGIDYFEYNNQLVINLDESQYSGIAPDMGCYEYDPVETNELIIQNLKLKIQNYPNPFNPSTTIYFSLPEASHAELAIYNIKGQLVQILANEFLPAGNYTRIWNGCDNQNNALSSGIYLLSLQTDNYVRTQKITLLK